MTKIDLNKIAALVALIVIVTLSAVYGYRLEIGREGLIFERTEVLHQPQISD
jgi:hypothetical protein